MIVINVCNGNKVAVLIIDITLFLQHLISRHLNFAIYFLALTVQSNNPYIQYNNYNKCNLASFSLPLFSEISLIDEITIVKTI